MCIYWLNIGEKSLKEVLRNLKTSSHGDPKHNYAVQCNYYVIFSKEFYPQLHCASEHIFIT